MNSKITVSNIGKGLKHLRLVGLDVNMSKSVRLKCKSALGKKFCNLMFLCTKQKKEENE